MRMHVQQATFKSRRACQAGAALAVAHVGLDGADQQRRIWAAPALPPVPGLQGAQLLPVAGHLCSMSQQPNIAVTCTAPHFMQQRFS